MIFAMCFYVLGCKWALTNQRSISVCEIKKKNSRYCTTIGSIESTWIYLYHINDNRKLVTTLYTQDNRKNITEMTYVICMHGDY